MTQRLADKQEPIFYSGTLLTQRRRPSPGDALEAASDPTKAWFPCKQEARLWLIFQTTDF